MTKAFKSFLSVCLVIILTGPWFAVYSSAQRLSSPNFQIENPVIGSGDTLASSTNYSEVGSIGPDNNDSASSSNYRVFPGFVQHAYPGVPSQPTLTNTGGTLYNSLDYVISTGGNQSDTNYAIAISPDNFVSTYFVQADNTIATSTVWQAYTAWGGGSGGRVTGLNASSTYITKVKARFGQNTETAYSITASAITANPNFTMSINAVNSGTIIAGATSTVTSGTNSISFGTLVPDILAVAIQKITVTTNAAGGYTTKIVQDGPLTSAGSQISPVSGTNASPVSFPTTVSTGSFGYHTTDAALCTGSATRFSSADTYAQLTTSSSEIACSQAPVSNEDTYIVYKALVGSLQAAGAYNNTITYVSYGVY